MKTLSEHNREVRGAHERESSGGAGIRCDKCGVEMRVDGEVTASQLIVTVIDDGKEEFSGPVTPPLYKQPVRCPRCGYEGVMEA